MVFLEATKIVKAKCYEAVLDIGFPRKRPDIISVLKRAQENGGYINANDVSNHLLGGKPSFVGKTIIRRLIDLHLIDENGSITENGIEALKEEDILLPEHGAYLIWVIEDPIFTLELIGLEKAPESNLHEDIYRFRNNTTQEEKTITTLEDLSNLEILQFKRHMLTLSSKEDELKGKNIFVYKLEKNGYRREKLDVDVKIILRENEGTTFIILKKENEYVKGIIELDTEELISEVVNEQYAEWNGRFLDFKDFNIIEEDSRRRFIIDKKTKSTNIIRKDDKKKLGEYSLQISNISINTTYNHVGESWLKWLLIDEIKDYIDNKGLSNLSSDIVKSSILLFIRT